MLETVVGSAGSILLVYLVARGWGEAISMIERF